MNRRSFLTAAGRARPRGLRADAARLERQGADPLSRPRHRLARQALRQIQSSATPPSSGCGPARCGPKGRPGTASAAIWSGATFPTTARCAGSRKTATSAPSAIPPDYSNGNTFDYEGRQLSCQHGDAARRPLRARRHRDRDRRQVQGKPLNSPNDVVVHPDGGIWFTDPPYGIMGNYEGFQAKQEIKEAVYRVDPKTGKMDKVTDELDKPNGLCFSPDYKKLYVCDTGARARDIQVFDWSTARRCATRSSSTNMKIAGRGRRPRPTASAPTWTATSGPAPAGSARATTASTSSRRTAAHRA